MLTKEVKQLAKLNSEIWDLFEQLIYYYPKYKKFLDAHLKYYERLMIKGNEQEIKDHVQKFKNMKQNLTNKLLGD